MIGDHTSHDSISIRSSDFNDTPGDYFHPPLMEMLSEKSSEFNMSDENPMPNIEEDEA